MNPRDPRYPDASASRPLAAVTGATGFIGRHLVDALGQAGWRVRLLLDRFGRPQAQAHAFGAPEAPTAPVLLQRPSGTGPARKHPISGWSMSPVGPSA